MLAYDSVGDGASETFPDHTFTRATVWDPQTGSQTPATLSTGYNVFCSGLAHLSDGTLFLAGGNKNSALDGIVQTHVFDHETNTWSVGPNMAAERWYPTVTPLRNGEMLITEGGPDVPEVRTTGGNLRSLSTAALDLPLYPWMHAAPDGRAFYAGPSQTMRALNTSGTGAWQSLGQRDAINRDYGSHALFDVGKILVAGGGASSADARVVNINGATPQVSATAPMASGRRQHNLTVLADGSVLATGGNSSGASLVDLDNGVYAAERWNPATGAWSTMAAEQATRQYHSTALLLPDGRVLSSGGGLCGTCDEVGYLAKNAQVFTPPYLFKSDGSGELAPRPRITGAPATADHGANFQIDTPDAAAIRKVALVRLGAVTHSVNMEQRYVPLSFTAGTGSLTATAPANINIAPPGVYMLFIVDANGVPSVARMVTLTGADPPPPPPPPSSGLVGAWGFSEGSGTTTADASGNGNAGTITGATWTAQGRHGSALSFNGTSSLVRVASSPSLNLTTGMTLSAWVRPTAAQGGWRTILQRQAEAYFLHASHGAVPGSPAGGGTFGGSIEFLGGSSAIPVNAWTHVALTYDLGALRLYIDGTQVATRAASGAIQTNTNPLWIGGNQPFGEHFQGLIDEARVYNRALTPAEIQTDMSTPVAPPAPDTTPPTAPSRLAATAVSGSRIDLNWNASTDNVGVAEYRVERCQGASCTDFAQVGTPATTSFSSTGLLPDTTYRFRVRAVDAAGNLSPYSAIVTGATLAPDTSPPTAPSGLVATAVSNAQIDLDWAASTDNVGVSEYRVERCQGAGCTNFAEVASPTATAYSDTGLSPSTTYRYRVRAIDAAGNLGGYSNVAEAVTAAAPPTPTGLVGAWGFSEGSGTTTGDASGNGNAGTITGATWTAQGRYGSALSFNGTSSLVRVASSASLNVTAGMTLSAWVRPTAAQGGWRTILQRQPEAYFLHASHGVGPMSPAGGGTFGGSTEFLGGSSAIPVNAWTHVALTYDLGALRLYVNGTQVATRAASGAIETNANPLWIGGNQPYGEHFQGLIDEARVYNRALTPAEIQTDMSNPVTPTPPDTTPPSAPSNLGAAAAGSSQINVTWNASTDNVGVAEYRVERCQGAACTDFTQVGTTAATTFNDSGLTPSTTYRYRVRAADPSGNLSGYSAITTATTAAASDTTPPSAPTGLAATAVSTSQVDLTWNASTDNVGVTGYRVERCQGAGCTSFTEITSTTNTAYSDTGRQPGTVYRYRVRALDAAGNLSTYSGITTATTPSVADTSPPTAPTGLTAAAVGGGQVDLSWSAATDNVGVTGYRVERCQGQNCTGFAEVAAPTGTTHSDGGLSPSTTYRYRVRAVDAAGNLGGYSDVAEATTGTAPPAPAGLVGAWAFGEGAGTTTADASGRGNVGTITGAAWTTQGRYGNALSFNGAGNVVQVANSTSLDLTSQMTLSAWIRPTASQTGWRTIVQRQSEAYFLHASGDSPGRPTGGGTLGGNVQYLAGPTANPVNAWTHVALTYDGAALRLYVNGTQVASQAATGAVQNVDNPLWIGGNSPYGEYFQGLIDEVRVYDRALSQADIETDMNSPIDWTGLPTVLH